MADDAHALDVMSWSATAFRAHVMELADQIRTIAADKLVDAYARSEEGREELLDDPGLGEPESFESYRRLLRDVQFSWVNDYFERGAGVPIPEQSMNLANAIVPICGDGALSRDSVIQDAGAAAAAEELTEVQLGPGLLGDVAFASLGSIQTLVQPWTSGAVDAFKQRFLPLIPVAISNQVIVAKVLRNVMAANYRMLALTRADVDGIAHDTITALEFEDGFWSGDNDARATLGIVSGISAIIAGVATLPVSGPAGAAAAAAGAFTILDGAASTWATLEETRAQGEEITLGADTIDGILDNMAVALDRVYQELDDGNRALRDVLIGVEDGMAATQLNFLAPRPVTFAEATQDNVVAMIEAS